jgi:hypothetical protein
MSDELRHLMRHLMKRLLRRSAPPHTPEGVVVAQISETGFAPLAPPCSTTSWRSGADCENKCEPNRRWQLNPSPTAEQV